MTVARRIYFLILIACVGFGISAFFSFRSLGDLKGVWDHFQQDVVTRQTGISKLRSSLGYGAFIHNFKNYVLRGTPKYYEQLQTEQRLIQAQLDDYLQLNELNEGEEQAIHALRTMVRAYSSAVDRAKKLKGEGKKPEEIDQMIKISDGPAIQALGSLQAQFEDQSEEHSLEFQQEMSRAILALWITLSGTVLLLVIFGVKTARSIIRPLGGEPAQMDALARKVAGGDLNIWTDQRSHGLYRSILDMAIKLKGVMSIIRINANRLAETTVGLSANGVKIQQAAKAVNEGIESNSAALMQSSANTSALSGAIQELAESSQEIFQLANTASEEAHVGQQAMEETNLAINKISESSNKINGIIDVITEIANQTNLLSLNAAIEAAKAGEVGKGFAVVAEEVRNLADRSSVAVEQIRVLIEVSSTNVKEGKEVIHRTAEVLGRIIGQVNSIAEKGNRMALEMEEKKAGAIELDQAINEITQTSETNAEAMTKLFVELSQIESTLGNFAEMAKTLQTEVAYFKFEQPDLERG